VRALVHSIQRAPRIGRLPIQLCRGNLDDADSLAKAMGESHIVIHCALDENYQSVVPHLRRLLRRAESTKVRRFIHLSSTAVYGMRHSPACEEESAPLRRTGNAYSDNKMYAEEVAMRFVRRGLPLVILRPSIVYGPFSLWDIRAVQELREGHLRLIDGGRGICNTTYVDNLIDAIFLSIENDRALGEAFFITDGERVTWGDFIRAHAAMMDPKPNIGDIASQEIEAYWQRQPSFWRKSVQEARGVFLGAELRRLLKRIPVFDSVLSVAWHRMRKMGREDKDRLRNRILGVNGMASVQASRNSIPDLISCQIQTGSGHFRIDKASRILGYQPRISFAHGIALVEQWLHFANYL